MRHTLIGIEFQFVACFKDTKGCSCPCCEFRQLAKVAINVGGIAVADTLAEPHKEDCIVIDDQGKPLQPGGSSSNVILNGRKPGQLGPGEFLQCYGRKDLYWLLTNYGRGSEPESSSGPCKYGSGDSPYVPVLWGWTYDLTYDFLGLIVDTCIPSIKAARRFQWKAKGAVLSDGSVSAAEFSAQEVGAGGEPLAPPMEEGRQGESMSC
jgi:hypothetical protein